MFDTRERRISKSRIYIWRLARCTDPANNRDNNTVKVSKETKGSYAEYSRDMKVSVTRDVNFPLTRAASLAHPRSRANAGCQFGAYARFIITFFCLGSRESARRARDTFSRAIKFAGDQTRKHTSASEASFMTRRWSHSITWCVRLPHVADYPKLFALLPVLTRW